MTSAESPFERRAIKSVLTQAVVSGSCDELDVVLAHDFAVDFGGAERLVASIAAAFPRAPFWTITGRREVAGRMGVADRFFTLFAGRPFVAAHYRVMAPAYPAIVRSKKLPDADVLLTSSFGFAHGFRTANDAPQLCYCHAPLRFAWSMTEAYGQSLSRGPISSFAFRGLASGLRSSDRHPARNVTRYLASSNYVADQISRFYDREASVVPPPVDCARFRPGSTTEHDDYFLFCGRLVEPYKRPGLAIEAFDRLPYKLKVVGSGPALPGLRQIAGSNVEFLGQLDDEELVAVMQRCAAVIFPSRDDFGMIPLEVMACGRPVLAYGAGGALETVVPGLTGEFFFAQETDALVAAIEAFDPEAYDPAMIRAHAERWGMERFQTAVVAAAHEVAASRRC